LLGLPLLSSVPFRATDVWAQSILPVKNGSNGSIGEFFRGEELQYDIGFWFFRQAAVARISFEQGAQKGRYEATLRGETKGVIGLITLYRTDTFHAIMEEVDGGRRLRPVSFEEYTKIVSSIRKRSHLFDYQRRKWTQHTTRKNGRIRTVEEDIPEGKIYDDYLTASYNFRFGVYGPIERGRSYSVPTFPKKGPSSYEVRVASREDEERIRKAEQIGEEREYLIKLNLDPEVTHSKEGTIEGWLSKDLRPMEGTIKDAIFFGDVQGTLVKSGKTQQRKVEVERKSSLTLT
jgi:hypothetical protein